VEFAEEQEEPEERTTPAEQENSEIQEKAEKKDQPVSAFPGSTVSTHAAVSNNGSIDAFVFMEVTVPMVRSTSVKLEKGVTVRPDGWVPVLGYTADSSWTLIEETVQDGVLTQVYCYGTEDEMVMLKPGESTTPLFDEWTVINVRVYKDVTGDMRWSQIAEMCAEAGVRAYSIQAHRLGNALRATTVWGLVK